MPILEKLAQPSQARHWTDSIPLEFHYTAGVAGEEFRRELRDNGRFLVSKCSKCKSTYIPARMYCPACFIGMKVTPSLKNSSERTGAITDILAFRPASTGPIARTAEVGKTERWEVGAGE